MSIQNSKLQRPNFRETSKSKHQPHALPRRSWGFSFEVSLEFGVWSLVLLLSVCFCSQSRSADLTPAQTQFFENKIRPIFANNCYKCHSLQAEKVRAGLLLDSKEGVRKGGETGPAIVLGDPEKSLLI